MDKASLGTVHALISMSTKEVALSLGQILRKQRGGVSVKVGGELKGRRGNSERTATPTTLRQAGARP